MGGQQSRPSQSQLANEKLIIERLQALQAKDRTPDDGEYVCVGGDEKPRPYVSRSAGLSISALKQWEYELLQDPKNRWVGC